MAKKKRRRSAKGSDLQEDPSPKRVKGVSNLSYDIGVTSLSGDPVRAHRMDRSKRLVHQVERLASDGWVDPYDPFGPLSILPAMSASERSIVDGFFADPTARERSWRAFVESVCDQVRGGFPPAQAKGEETRRAALMLVMGQWPLSARDRAALSERDVGAHALIFYARLSSLLGQWGEECGREPGLTPIREILAGEGRAVQRFYFLDHRNALRTSPRRVSGHWSVHLGHYLAEWADLYRLAIDERDLDEQDCFGSLKQVVMTATSVAGRGAVSPEQAGVVTPHEAVLRVEGLTSWLGFVSLEPEVVDSDGERLIEEVSGAPDPTPPAERLVSRTKLERETGQSYDQIRQGPVGGWFTFKIGRRAAASIDGESGDDLVRFIAERTQVDEASARVDLDRWAGE
ncbi:MAG: hypothetical protein AAF517_04565 [Planctomycetota bacterium]